MSREVKDAKDLETGKKIYLKGHAKATYMSDGLSVEDAINDLRENGGGSSDATEKLVVNILSNQPNDTEIAAVKAVVRYGDVKMEVSGGESVKVPAGIEVFVEFPKVDGYKKPADVTLTTKAGTNTASGTYATTIVTVNVSAEDGASVEGQVVTVEKSVTVDCTPDYEKIDRLGVAIMDIYGKFYKDADEWIEAGRPTPNGIAVSDGVHRFCIAMRGVEGYDGWKAAIDAQSATCKDSHTWGYPSLAEDYSGYDGSGINHELAKDTFVRNFGVINFYSGLISEEELSEIRLVMNSSLIAAFLGRDVSVSCFLETFPNGHYGYLASSGEWYLASTLNKKIDFLLRSIGGSPLSDTAYPFYWTGTGVEFGLAETGSPTGAVYQCLYTDIAVTNEDTGGLELVKAGTMELVLGELNVGGLRAFCSLEPKHQAITASERLVVKNGKVTFRTPYESTYTVLAGYKDGYVIPERLDCQAGGNSDVVNIQYRKETSMTVDYQFYAGGSVTVVFENDEDGTEIAMHNVGMSASQLLTGIEEGTVINARLTNYVGSYAMSGDTTFTFTNGGTARITITEDDGE